MLAQVVVLVRLGGAWVPAGLVRHFDGGRDDAHESSVARR
jgi:hypothetical protein